MARRQLRTAFGDSSPETNPGKTPSTEVAVTTSAEVEESRSARLAALTRTITSAWTTYGSTVRAAQEQFARQAGPAIEEVHRDELWREEGWPSFNAWFKHIVGFESSHVYEILDGVKVSRVLGQPVNIGQGRALAPVLRKHGEDAVRRQWSAAEAAGRPTAKMLKAKAIDLGFQAPPKPRKASAIAEVKPGQTVATQVFDAEIVDAEIVADEADPQPPTLYALRSGLREHFRSTRGLDCDLAGFEASHPAWDAVKDVGLLARMLSNWARQIHPHHRGERRPSDGTQLVERLEEILTDPNHDVLDVTGLDAADADQLARMARLLDDLAGRIRTENVG